MIEITKNTQGSNDDACCGDFNSLLFGLSQNTTLSVAAAVKNLSVYFTKIPQLLSAQVWGNNIEIIQNQKIVDVEFKDLLSSYLFRIIGNPLLTSLSADLITMANVFLVAQNNGLPTLSFLNLITAGIVNINNNGLTDVALSKLEGADVIDINNNIKLTNVQLNSLSYCNSLSLNNNDLPDAVIDNLFIQLNANLIAGCTISVVGQVGGGTATAASLAERNNLISNGCTIIL